MTSASENATLPHRSDQLVVASPYQRPVLAALLAMELNSARERDTSAELGLSLIEFDEAQLHAWWGEDYQLGPSAIDALIASLRTSFGRRYDRWYPTLGKNRLMQHVDSVYHVGGWGEDGIMNVAAGQLALRDGDLGKGVRVGVPDTGIYPNPWLGGGFHALESSLLRPTPIAEAEVAPVPVSAGHATFVAGLILEEAPGATVEVQQCLDRDGQADVWQGAKAMVELARSGVQVLNVSFGCQTEDGQPPLVLAAAVDRLPSDVLVVAAAGNFGDTSGNSNPTTSGLHGAAWPAGLDDVIAVGALDARSEPASFSPEAPWVDVYAPGVRVTSTYLDSSFRVKGNPDSDGPVTPTGFACWSGTSFSAALVSGRVAARIVPGEVDARTAFAAVRETLQRPIELPGMRGSTQPDPLGDERRGAVR